MEIKKTTPEGAIQNSYCEDNNSSPVIQRIKQYFLDGEKGTAIDINQECFTGDARKVISDLRKQGWKIRDKVIRGTQKLYWLDHEQRIAIICGRWEGGEA